MNPNLIISKIKFMIRLKKIKPRTRLKFNENIALSTMVFYVRIYSFTMVKITVMCVAIRSVDNLFLRLIGMSCNAHGALISIVKSAIIILRRSM
jgi:hypothetical protein